MLTSTTTNNSNSCPNLLLDGESGDVASSSSLSSSPQMMLTRNSVSFSKVEVRGYDMTLGCNPSCSKGPAIQLSWDYDCELIDSVDNYESVRGPVRRQNKYEMLVPSAMRQAIVEGNGITRNEMQIMQAEMRTIQSSRRKHASQTPAQQRRDEILESTKRKLVRLTSLTKKNGNKNNNQHHHLSAAGGVGSSCMRRVVSLNDMKYSSPVVGILKKGQSIRRSLNDDPTMTTTMMMTMEEEEEEERLAGSFKKSISLREIFTLDVVHDCPTEEEEPFPLSEEDSTPYF